ncbi:MAG: metallophosphoesterase [Thermoplasmata archaeon]
MERLEVSDGIFITDDFCVYYPPRELIVLSDLHLGYEASLAEDGITVPRYQKERILDRLSTTIEKYSPSTILINGDLKHEFGRNRKQEFREVREIIDFIKERADLLIVRGNHDNFLKTITNHAGVPFFEDKITVDDITLAHGHKYIDRQDYTIIGHEHPSLNIRDEMGGTIKIPCFMYHRGERVLVLPAFSPLAIGRDLLKAKEPFSECIKDLNLFDFEIYGITDDGLMDFRTLADVKKAVPGLL